MISVFSFFLCSYLTLKGRWGDREERKKVGGGGERDEQRGRKVNVSSGKEREEKRMIEWREGRRKGGGTREGERENGGREKEKQTECIRQRSRKSRKNLDR